METGRTLMMPYHVRTIGNVPWQQYYLHQMDAADKSFCIFGMSVQHLSDSTSSLAPAGLGCKFRDFPKTPITETMLLDEVKGRMYFFPSNSERHFIIHESTVEIEKKSDGSRAVTGMREDVPYKSRKFFANFVVKPPTDHMIKWFLNPIDGSFLQIHSKNEMKKSGVLTCHIISWFQLDDRVKFNGDFDGWLNRKSHLKLEFPQFNMLDPFECGILFSDGGKKMLIRFRIPNPEFLNEQNTPENITNAKNSHNFNFTDEMSKPPTYALFGLDYESNKIQLLAQFVPTSEENHCDLLISSKLLSIYGLVNGFPNPVAQSFLSQQSRMIGQFLKYTFFSTISNTIGITAVKSLTKTLQTGRLSLTPKKIWFPLGDEKLKLEFKKLSEKPPKNPFPPEMTKEEIEMICSIPEIRKSFENMKEKPIKWEMLGQKQNITLVFGDEFILQIYDPDKKNRLKHLATIRVKLGPEYKDYKKCAGCGKGEKRKRRNKHGQRTSQFKVCTWCKAHHLHKLWWEQPCHYCSKKCAIDHFPIHKLQHKQQQIEGKVEGKK